MDILELVRHGSPETAFAVRSRTIAAPGQGQARIAVEVSGVNFADILARQGAYPEAPKLPCVLGFEVVGRVEAIGPGVTGLAPGQRVVAFTRFGGYASHVLAPAAAMLPIPEELDAGAAAALATQGTTAYLAAEWLVRIAAGDHVLVHAAAGGVGHLVVQLARHRGAVITATAGSDAKRAFLERLGVTHVIDSRARDFAAELLRRTDGRRPDVIFDSIGGASVRKGIALMASGGRIVCYGVADLAGKGWALPRAARLFLGFGGLHPLGLMARSKSVLGLNLLRLADDRPELLATAMKETFALAAAGILAPVVDRAFRAEQAAAAHAYVESRQSMGKVILVWNAID